MDLQGSASLTAQRKPKVSKSHRGNSDLDQEAKYAVEGEGKRNDFGSLLRRLLLREKALIRLIPANKHGGGRKRSIDESFKKKSF